VSGTSFDHAKCFAATRRRIAESTKKADVRNRPQAFHHVGLPIDKPVGQANLFFNMSSGIYQHEASRRSEPASEVSPSPYYSHLSFRQCCLRNFTRLVLL
jgi:hypothetical protein